MEAGDWCYSTDYKQFCQVIEAQQLWGEAICRVWLPDAGSVVCIPVSRLKPLDSVGPCPQMPLPTRPRPRGWLTR